MWWEQAQLIVLIILIRIRMVQTYKCAGLLCRKIKKIQKNNWTDFKILMIKYLILKT